MINVFDLMVPAPGTETDEDELLRATGPLAVTFVGLLAARVHEGELFGLVGKFEANGLTDKLESWIGRGDDVLLAPDEVRKVLGEDFLTALETQLAATGSAATPKGEELLASLAKLFPVVVRRFTRSGQIPPQRVLQRSAADFSKSFGIKA